MATKIIGDPCSSGTVIKIEDCSTEKLEKKLADNWSNDHIPCHFANSNSSSSSSKERIYFPFWLRISRIIFGKIRKLPKSMSTTLVLFTVHMYLTVPVIIVCGVTGDLKALLRPFRLIKQQGFLFEELGEQFAVLL